jgi:polyhydroxybutyrate depolymerase
MRRLTGLDAVADREGFLVVYPDGVSRQWNDGRAEVDPGVDDMAFVSALIDHLVEQYKSDRGRIYATGMSNGALFSFRLASDLSDKIAAIAPVGALMGEALSQRAPPAKPMPVLLIHGTQDPLVPWDGGNVQVFRRKRGRVLSAAATVAFWVKHNGCTPTPVITYEPDQDPTDGTRVRREEYRSGKDGSEVLLYAVEGGGHTWPGGWQYLPERIIGKTSRDFQASEVIWGFFKRHGKGSAR